MAARVLKLLCVFFSVLAVLLCGCAKKSGSGAEPVPGFQADFSADFRGMQLGGRVTNTRQGSFALSLTAPSTLNGLSIRSKNGELTLARGGAAATADEPYLPAESFPTLLRDLLRAASRGDFCGGGSGEIILSLPAGEGTLTLDGRGLPASAAVPGAGLEMRFSHAEPIG